MKTTLTGVRGTVNALKLGAECGARVFLASTSEVYGDPEVQPFDGADERDCSISIGNGMAIVMAGLPFLRAWALPHFISAPSPRRASCGVRGVGLGKQDYLSQVGARIRTQTTSPR